MSCKQNRWGAEIEGFGDSIEKSGTGIEKSGTGIERSGTGIEKSGTGIRLSIASALCWAVVAVCGLSMNSVLAAESTPVVHVEDSNVQLVWEGQTHAVVGEASLSQGYALFALASVSLDEVPELPAGLPPVQGGGTGTSGAEPPVQGSGSGTSSTKPPVQGGGTGTSSTAEVPPVQGGGTGQRSKHPWGYAEILVHEGGTDVIVYYYQDADTLVEYFVGIIPAE